MKNFIMVIFICLLIFTGCNNDKNLIYATKTEQTQQNDPLFYINQIRKDANLKTFSYNKILENSAKSHAIYSTMHKVQSHNQDENLEKFSGKTQIQRALNNGYNSTYVLENISFHGDFISSIDSLMSAIYHRFAFLHKGVDEIGFAMDKNKDFSTFVFNMGNSKLNELCKHNFSIKPNTKYVQNLCKNNQILIEHSIYEKLINPDYPPFVTFPNKFAIAYFSGEIPNPVAECQILSNPVSIEFSDTKNFVFKNFEIYKDGEKIHNTKLLNSNNDINLRLNNGQFALYSYDVFEFNKKYNVKFTYEKNGKFNEISWDFKTMTPKFDYFDVKGGENLAIYNSKTYDIFFRPKNCNDLIKNYKISSSGILEKNIDYIHPNIFRVNLKGYKNSKLTINANGKNITLVLKDGKIHKSYVFIAIICIGLSIFLFVRK